MKESIPDNILAKILEESKNVWPNDIEMQEYFIETETDSYLEIQKIDFTGAESIKEKLINDSFEINNSWEECFSIVESELKSYKFVKNFSDSEVPARLLKEFVEKAITDYPDYYEEQQNEIEYLVSKYKQRKKLNEEVGPLKDLLIELEAIIGNECSNEYSHWGSWNYSGSSFRYPLTIIRDNPTEHDEYKVKDVCSSTPIEELITGHYKFGANHLDIYKALVKVINHLRDNYGFEIPESKKL